MSDYRVRFILRNYPRDPGNFEFRLPDYIRVHRKQNDWDMRKDLANRNRGLEAVHLGHREVEND